MRLLFIGLIAFATITDVSGQDQSSGDSLKILNIISDWDKGWQTKDYMLAANGYSADAYFTNAFGDKRQGRSQVETLLKEVFSLPFVMAGNSETSEHRYQVLQEAVIVVHTSVIRKGQQLPDGSTLPDRRTTHIRVFQKVSHNWEIKSHLISDARDKQAAKH